jgi:hypothetical protein
MIPFASASRIPASIALAQSFESPVPLTFHSNSKPAPRSSGSKSATTWPYWPLPPDCFTYLPSPSADFVMASRYATCGRPTFAATLNSRNMRSTMTSRCSSPIPAMRVWPESGSVFTWNVGSSSASLARASDIFSSSAFVFGSTAIWMTGSGNLIASRMIGLSGSHSVSPVKVCFSPMAAAISPAPTSVTSSRLSAWSMTMREMRSFLSFVAL